MSEEFREPLVLTEAEEAFIRAARKASVGAESLLHQLNNSKNIRILTDYAGLNGQLPIEVNGEFFGSIAGSDLGFYDNLLSSYSFYSSQGVFLGAAEELRVKFRSGVQLLDYQHTPSGIITTKGVGISGMFSLNRLLLQRGEQEVAELKNKFGFGMNAVITDNLGREVWSASTAFDPLGSGGAILLDEEVSGNVSTLDALWMTVISSELASLPRGHRSRRH